MNPPLNILILEDEAALADALRLHISNNYPEALPLVARSIAEANVLNYQYEFAGYVIDLTLPDGSGVDFISDVKTVLPDANFVVITGLHTSEYQRQLSHVGSIRVIQKPFEFAEFDSVMSGFFPQLEATVPEFRGSLRKMRLVDLIQVKCLGADTCRVTIYCPGGERGVIGFYQGDIVHASAGGLAGKEAFNEMLRWKNGSFQEQEYGGGLVRNIVERWELVLMDAVRLSDEVNSMEVA